MAAALVDRPMELIIRLDAVDRPFQPPPIPSDPDSNTLHPDEALENHRNYIPPRERLKLRRQRRRDSRDAYLLRKERHHASITHNFTIEDHFPKISEVNKKNELVSMGSVKLLDKDSQIYLDEHSQKKEEDLDLPKSETPLSQVKQLGTQKELTPNFQELTSPDIFPLQQFLRHTPLEPCFEDGDDESEPSTEPSLTRVSTLDDSEQRRNLPGEIMDESEDPSLDRRSSTSDLLTLQAYKKSKLETEKVEPEAQPRPRKPRKSRARSEPFPFRPPECEACIIS